MKQDISIIGGGIVGLISAWRLAQAGANVTLYERGVCGSGCTGASLGGLVPMNWDKTRDFAIRQRNSILSYGKLAEEVKELSGLDFGYRHTKRIQLFDSTGQHAAALQNIAASNGQSEFLNEAQLHALNPNIMRNEFGALLCHTTGHIMPKMAIKTLKVLCKNIGVTIYEKTEIKDLKELNSGKILVACGAWSNTLVKEANVVPVKGQALKLHVEKPLFTHMVRRREIYLIPHENYVYVGATTEPEAGFDMTTQPETINMLHAKAAELVPALKNATQVAHWAGLRPKGGPARPLVEHMHSNVYLAAGHYKLGFCLAPAIGQAAVTTLLNT